jgi:hypothetical protein
MSITQHAGAFTNTSSWAADRAHVDPGQYVGAILDELLDHSKVPLGRGEKEWRGSILRLSM